MFIKPHKSLLLDRLLTPQALQFSFGTDNSSSKCHTKDCFLFTDSWTCRAACSCWQVKKKSLLPSSHTYLDKISSNRCECHREIYCYDKAPIFFLKRQLWNAFLLYFCALYAVFFFADILKKNSYNSLVCICFPHEFRCFSLDLSYKKLNRFMNWFDMSSLNLMLRWIQHRDAEASDGWWL